MSLPTVKSSTQDTSTGTPVATGNNENGTGAIQAFVAVGNKTTWGEASRTGLTTADAPASGNMTTTGFAGAAGANLSDFENALSCQVRATCGTASKNLAGRVVFYDSGNNCLGYSESVSFLSDATKRLGSGTGDFISQTQVVDVKTARKGRFFVESIDAGTWAVYTNPT
jgi:hypothetical protein